jgi:nucleoside-diphosphate-sugar epimerase
VYPPGPKPRFEEDAVTEASDAYALSKIAAEGMVFDGGAELGVPAAVLRFFTVYGPGQWITSGTSGVVAILGQRAVTREPMVVMSHQRKDLVDVSDVARAIVLALEHVSIPARPYNIATGVPTSVLELARALRRIAGCDSEIVEDYSEGDPGDLVADISRARQELGYEPRIDLEEGLRRYVDWLRSARPHSA